VILLRARGRAPAFSLLSRFSLVWREGWALQTHAHTVLYDCDDKPNLFWRTLGHRLNTHTCIRAYPYAVCNVCLMAYSIVMICLICYFYGGPSIHPIDFTWNVIQISAEVCAHAHAQMHTHTYASKHTHNMHKRAPTYSRTPSRSRAHAPSSHHTHTHIHTNTHVHTYTHMHTKVHAQTHTHMHANVDTHVHAQPLPTHFHTHPPHHTHTQPFLSYSSLPHRASLRSAGPPTFLRRVNPLCPLSLSVLLAHYRQTLRSKNGLRLNGRFHIERGTEREREREQREKVRYLNLWFFSQKCPICVGLFCTKCPANGYTTYTHTHTHTISISHTHTIWRSSS